MASSFSLKSSSYDGRYNQLTCTQTKNESDNTSTIKWTFTVAGGTKNYYTTGPVTITINGEQVYYVKQTYWDTHKFPAKKGSVSGSLTVKHDSNGSKTIKVVMKTAIYSDTVSTYSDDWTLDTIPRQSTASSTPTWTAPNGVTCSISRASNNFTHTVYLDLKNSSGTWVNIGKLTGQTTSATFNTEAIMKNAFTVLNGRASCEARFSISTYNGSTKIGSDTYSGTGTCTAASANTCTAPSFTGTNSVSTTITKGNSSFTSDISVTINGQNIGSVSKTSGTTFTFNNTTALRKACITGLAQANSKSYNISITTYYSGIRVRGTLSYSGTCTAPSVDRITAPNWTAGEGFNSTITTDSSELSRTIVLQMKNSSGNWVNINSVTRTTSTSDSWAGTEAQRDNIFSNLNGAASRETRFLVTTYYDGVQVRSADNVTSGTCTAPAASTCTVPNWTAGSTFTCSINRTSTLLTHSIVLKVKDSNGNLQTFQTVDKSSSTEINFANTVDLNTTLFNYLAQNNSRDTEITITTYYKDIIVRSSITYNGTLNTTEASYLGNTPSWTAGDNFSFTISKANNNYTHRVEFKVNSQSIKIFTGLSGSSTSFGDTDADRTSIYIALNKLASAPTEAIVTTYYNGVQVRQPVSKSGTCTIPSQIKPSAPTWTAGNSFQAEIALSKPYLCYSIELKVGSEQIQKYEFQSANSLGFAGTAELNLKAYKGLNKNVQATSQFIITMYYKTDNGEYVRVGPEYITNGVCTALAANTITTPNWTAGSNFAATIIRKSLNLYSSIKLKVNGNIVQEYPIQTNDNLNYSLLFANTKEINTKVYQSLEQAASKVATLEITTYYGTSADNVIQVRTPIIASGICNSSEPSSGTLSSDKLPAVIDNTIITCDLTKPLADYELSVEVKYNNNLITTLTPTEAEPQKVIFDSSNFINLLYQSIPTQTSASLQFKVITRYNGIQVQQPKTVAIDMNAKEETVKVKIDNGINISTLARVIDRTNTFIDNTSMIGSKLSDLLLEINKGYFYLETKYGGFIKQIQIQIAKSSSMLQVYNYREEDIVYNNERTRIVNPEFTDDNSIIMGPYDFPSVTEPSINNLTITVTDSRGYTVQKIIQLRIFPYNSPTIKIDQSTTKRIVGAEKYCIFNLSGTISSLYKEQGETKIQTNLIKKISIKYKTYGSLGEYSIYELPSDAFNYNDTFTSFTIDDFSTAVHGESGSIEFNINDTFEIVVVVEDQYGRTNSDSIIILPGQPLMSFRDKRIGINIVPRKLDAIIERESSDDEYPSLDVNGYIYSNGREVITFTIDESWSDNTPDYQGIANINNIIDSINGEII